VTATTLRPARVLVLRGHQATPWELRPWERLDPERFEVALLWTASNDWGIETVRLARRPARTLRDLAPLGRAGALATRLFGDRYRDADDHFGWADIVHAEELSYWFTAEAARRKARHGFRLALTVWETLPLLRAYRTPQARARRARALAAADLYLPATERARAALRLEGIPEERIVVCPPGIDVDRFQAPAGGRAPADHVIVSPGRLVWEKGHHDVLRALAALHRGIVEAPPESRPRVLVVGEGPERARLLAHAAELGVADHVEVRSVPYDQMPGIYARASAVVLASLPHAALELPGRPPRAFWEEQFGMVLAEALAARVPIVAARSGAIPEVCGTDAATFDPGDWVELARVLAAGPLSRAPGQRVTPDPDRIDRYSTDAAARRLEAAYDRLLH
jgi:glycosyltransferase involved in cell wall biosynthesis